MHDDNIQRRRAGRTRTFYDDCGACDKKGGRISMYPYVMESNGSMRRLFLINKQYCCERKQNGRRTYDLLQPQPRPESVSTLTRYYVACGADMNFRKRVTWFSPSIGAPATEQESSYAVYEYRGKQPQAVQHGNAKNAAVPYVRTHPTVLDKVGAQVQHAVPKDVYNDLLQSSDPADAPRNMQSVRNKKHYEKNKGCRKEEGHRYNLNFANEILHVLALSLVFCILELLSWES